MTTVVGRGRRPAMDYRNALITGASSGLGAGLALRLAARGTRVFAVARREDRLAQLATDAAAAGDGEIVPVVLDVCDTAAVAETVRRVDTESGGLDLVVANAGLGRSRPARKLSWEKDVERLLQVNVMGAIATLTAALPAMVVRNRGHLVGISSLAGLRGLPQNAAYSASKAALSTFLESLAIDLDKTGIAVTCVNPGFVKTEMTATNKGPMPFLMELDDAVDVILDGIDKRRTLIEFPWSLTQLARALRAMPDRAYQRLARTVAMKG
jgi:short-subunit dehydrogenase